MLDRYELDRQIQGTKFVLERVEKKLEGIKFSEISSEEILKDYIPLLDLKKRSEIELNVLEYVRQGRNYKGDRHLQGK